MTVASANFYLRLQTAHLPDQHIADPNGIYRKIPARELLPRYRPATLQLNFKSGASQYPLLRTAAMRRSTDVEDGLIPEARAAGYGRL
jgi:hypothetical protein